MPSSYENSPRATHPIKKHLLKVHLTEHALKIIYAEIHLVKLKTKTGSKTVYVCLNSISQNNPFA